MTDLDNKDAEVTGLGWDNDEAPKVVRFDVDAQLGFGASRPVTRSPSGNMVRYEDYQALLAERDKQIGYKLDYKAAFEGAIEERDDLRAIITEFRDIRMTVVYPPDDQDGEPQAVMDLSTWQAWQDDACAALANTKGDHR